MYGSHRQKTLAECSVVWEVWGPILPVGEGPMLPMVQSYFPSLTGTCSHTGTGTRIISLVLSKAQASSGHGFSVMIKRFFIRCHVELCVSFGWVFKVPAANSMKCHCPPLSQPCPLCQGQRLARKQGSQKTFGGLLFQCSLFEPEPPGWGMFWVNAISAFLGQWWVPAVS